MVPTFKMCVQKQVLVHSHVVFSENLGRMQENEWNV
jgi:hypothetical protein